MKLSLDLRWVLVCCFSSKLRSSQIFQEHDDGLPTSHAHIFTSKFSIKNFKETLVDVTSASDKKSAFPTMLDEKRNVRCICRHLVHLYDNMKDDLLIPNGWRSPITFERVRKLTIPKQSHQQKCKFDDRSFTTWWFQICFLHPKFWGNGPISQIFVQMG